ncbi:MAG TPA: hypothetical protein VMG36_03750 [Thermoplasmata archaeon]|nr:hypothetical protein [Thermoplasmata archaeon]
MLTASDLEVNVLEFRQRSFQFDRLAAVDGTELAVFSRTETESESQFRPRLLHLRLVVPLAWIVQDEGADLLRVAKDGRALPMAPDAPVTEVRAERPEFKEDGVAWRRVERTKEALVYLPVEWAERALAPAAARALGLP